MDTSKEYILQCAKAEEMLFAKWKEAKTYPLGLMPWENGDMIALYGEVFMYDSCSASEGFIEPQIYNRDCIWLPRQDQLQEMVFMPKEMMLADLVRKLDRFCSILTPHGEDYNEYAIQFTSMEQLWLAFVMFELYQKIWFNGEWVKEPNKE